MQADAGSGAARYDRLSKVLAALLSPWVLLVVSAFFLGTIYVFYYRPRLFYSYSAFPPGKNIYLTLPFWRRRNFVRNPVQFFKDAQLSSTRRAIFWTDAIRVPGAKTISIICDAKMASQFLEIDDQDTLSWDAPLRTAWNEMFDSTSFFGRKRHYYNAGRYLLINGFSEELTKKNSLYAHIAQNVAHKCTAAHDQDLFGLVDQIAAQSLLSIILGDQENVRDLVDVFNQLSAYIIASPSVSQRAIKQTAASLRSALLRILQDRLNDIEQAIGHKDYLQFLIHNKHIFNEDVSGPGRPRAAGSNSDINDAVSEFGHDLCMNITDHLLVTLLQTRLLVASCATWKVISHSNRDGEADPAPLLLIRETREETLFGSKIVPKNCLVAIAPAVQTAYRPRSSRSRLNAFSDHRQLSTSDLDDISTTCSTADSPRSGHLNSIARKFGSVEGKSSLLSSTRYSSTVSMTNLFEDTKVQLTQSDRTWSRRYPQNNLIQLLVELTVQTTLSRFTVRPDAIVSQRYGSARALWLPFPTNSILLDHVTNDTLHNKSPQAFVSTM